MKKAPQARKNLCQDIERSKRFIQSRTRALAQSRLNKKAGQVITRKLCRYHSASKNQQRKIIRKQLRVLAKRGLITQQDQAVLARAVIDPSILAEWKPSTDFGRALKEESEDVDVQKSMGAAIGGIIGGLIGGAVSGGAGIAPGAAIGGALGNIIETVVSDSGDDSSGGSSDGGDTEEGGSGDTGSGEGDSGDTGDSADS